jgi:membrane associated rhomboid family serine protease
MFLSPLSGSFRPFSKRGGGGVQGLISYHVTTWPVHLVRNFRVLTSLILELWENQNLRNHQPPSTPTSILQGLSKHLAMPPRLNIPPITRFLLIALVAQSLLSFAIRYRQWSEESDIVVPYLVLVPQLSLIYPWTFLTTTLVENNVFTLGISGVTIYYGGRYLERAWTSVEFGKFLLIAALIPNLACFGVLVILFAMSGDMSWT